MKAYLEARQREDLARDWASRLMPTDGPLQTGNKVYDWRHIPSKIKPGAKHGVWIKSNNVGFNGSLAIVDTGTIILRVSQTKL